MIHIVSPSSKQGRRWRGARFDLDSSSMLKKLSIRRWPKTIGWWDLSRRSFIFMDIYIHYLQWMFGVMVRLHLEYINKVWSHLGKRTKFSRIWGKPADWDDMSFYFSYKEVLEGIWLRYSKQDSKNKVAKLALVSKNNLKYYTRRHHC